MKMSMNILKSANTHTDTHTYKDEHPAGSVRDFRDFHYPAFTCFTHLLGLKAPRAHFICANQSNIKNIYIYAMFILGYLFCFTSTKGLLMLRRRRKIFHFIKREKIYQISQEKSVEKKLCSGIFCDLFPIFCLFFCKVQHILQSRLPNYGCRNLFIYFFFVCKWQP